MNLSHFNRADRPTEKSRVSEISLAFGMLDGHCLGLHFQSAGSQYWQPSQGTVLLLQPSWHRSKSVSRSGTPAQFPTRVSLSAWVHVSSRMLLGSTPAWVLGTTLPERLGAFSLVLINKDKYSSKLENQFTFGA